MMRQRDETLSALKQQPVDLLVIGGGIIGAGIARDAALRGLKVALVEQSDFAAGTSSRPTRLIHGGLRYLEQYDFGLVREDLREREILLHMAPHLVFPLPFLMPLYGRDWFYQAKLRAGMELYDVLSFDKSLPGRRWLTREQTLQTEPAMNPEGLQGAWRFYDAQVPLVERLVLENLQDAAAHGAMVLNHARAERLYRGGDGRVLGALIRDALSGLELDVRAAVTVNASGPWLDLTSTALRPGKPPLLRLTKGVHLVSASGTATASVLFAQSDGRLFFVVPWRGLSVVGTTDTDYEGDPARAEAEDADVQYLLEEAGRAFPRAPFDRVHYTWAGVRALVRVEGVAEGQVSRKHRVLDHETSEGVAGVISVVGGKITAYRGIAAEVIDLVGRKLGRRARGYTERRPLPGGRLDSVSAFLEREVGPRAQALGLDLATARHLVEVYGSAAHEVLARVEREPDLAVRLVTGEVTIAAQVARAVEDEWAVNLADILLRRTGLGLRPGQALAHLEAVARVAGDRLGWDEAARADQVEAYRLAVAPMRRHSRDADRQPVPVA